MKCDDTEPLGRHIYLTAQQIKNYAEKLLHPHGLTLEQFHLLKNMSTDSGISQRELGELAEKTPTNITRILDRLEPKNLVVRRNDPDDRRTTQVLLTDRGDELVQEVFAVFESFSEKLTKGISSEEQQVAIQVLDRIEQNINQMSQQS